MSDVVGRVTIVDKVVDRRCNMCETAFPALFTPEISLWAKGAKRTDHEPAVMHLSVIYCLVCKPTDDVFLDEMFPPKLRADLSNAANAAGRASFNWASAQIEWLKI